ncbi:NCA2-domain-containing protein [Martensiomyces pterosporus]|nr:NCA2-domain-containing protein [Martensiomyces pterosporus]
MSFVDEHYSNVFRALASTTAADFDAHSETSAKSLDTPKGEQAEAALQDGSSASARLAGRAFDLSTLLLAAPGNERQRKRQRSDSSADGSALAAQQLSSGQHQSRFGDRNAVSGGIKSASRLPSLSSAISDLQLIQESAEDGLSIVAAGQKMPDTELVLMNAIATIHAHSIEQLLAAVLPLSIDMEYWGSQDSSAISLALYFVQSLPLRLYSWSSRTAVAVFEYAASKDSPKRSLLAQVHAAMSSRHLFPDLLSIVSKSNGNRKSLHPRLSLPGVPEHVDILSLTRREIRQKQRHLADAQEKLAVMIGQLSQAAISGASDGGSTSPEVLLAQIADVVSSATNGTGPAHFEGQHTPDTANLAKTAESLALQVQSLSVQFASQIQKHRRPSLLSRAWLPALVAACSIKYLSAYIVGHSEDFKEWAADGAVTLRNYISQYILVPLRSGYETIRYGKHTYSVMTEESLASDFKSLEDMVVGFAARLGSIDAAEVRQRVEDGDLSDVMRVYTREMQQPFRNAVFGDLVEAMLIQVQKVKVDVGQTMAALDKLLKSNELNFLLLSTVPATLSIYSAFRWISSTFSWWVNGSSRHTVTSIQMIMRDIDRLLNIDSDNAQRRDRDMSGLIQDLAPSSATQGRLICYTHYLRYHAMSLPNSASAGTLRTNAGRLSVLPHAKTLFLQDVRDLESASLSSRQKRNVVERMYRTFRFL